MQACDFRQHLEYCGCRSGVTDPPGLPRQMMFEKEPTKNTKEGLEGWQKC